MPSPCHRRLHDTVKYGARFDGNGEGHHGLMHHNVIWNCGKGLMIKGYEHRVYHNTAFDNTNGIRRGNDLLIMIDQGGNAGTETISNAANRISGHRTGSYEDHPVPGTYRANWCARATQSFSEATACRLSAAHSPRPLHPLLARGTQEWL